MRKLSAHFSFEELTKTNHRSLRRENRRVAKAHIGTLQMMADDTMETIRGRWKKRFKVHSCFRYKALNKRVGSGPGSQHTVNRYRIFTGAVDFHIDGVLLREVFDWIRKDSDLKFHQLIFEGTWIHFGMATGYRDMQVFELNHITGRKKWISKGEY